MNHLHLATLLQSGVALELPDGSRLTAGVLRPQSPWVGKQIQSRSPNKAISDSKIVAVLRGKSVLLARPDTVLQPGDRLLLVIEPGAEAELAEHLAPAETDAATATTTHTPTPAKWRKVLKRSELGMSRFGLDRRLRRIAID